MMSKKKLMLAGGGALASIAIFGLLFTTIIGGSNNTPDAQLDTALSILDQGRWDVAKRIAQDLESKVVPEENSKWNYLTGVAAISSVEDRLHIPKNRKKLLAATDHLVKAKEIGFPAGYRGKGNFYLGWCFFNTFRWDEAITQLRDTHILWPAKRSDAYQMMVQAELRKSPPDYDAARQILDVWKAIPGMSESEMARIKLAESQLAFRNQQMTECESLLSSISKDTPEYYFALVAMGRWRLEHASNEEADLDSDERSKLLEEAEAIFRQVKVAAKTQSQLRRQATYLSGKGLLAQGKQKEALGVFGSMRQSEPQSAEGIASGVAETEILLREGDFESTVDTARGFLRNLGDLTLYDERWIPALELKLRLLDIGRSMQNQDEFPYAIRMAEDIALVFPRVDSIRLQAETYEQWGDKLKQALDYSPVDVTQMELEEIRRKYATAAEKFEQLSKLTLRSSEFTTVLWRSIENYQRAHNLEKANTLLEDYIRFEERTKRPRGFLEMGKNLMDAGRWENAITPLQRCLVEYPDHPVSSDARLLAAQANIELNRLDEATELLEQNLYGFELHPTNSAWRDSLFELGETLFRQGEQLLLEVSLNPKESWSVKKEQIDRGKLFLQNASERLGEASSRWPEDPRHFEARHLLARSYGLSAEIPTQMMAANPNMLESDRRKMLAERRDLLEQALSEYRSLHQAINQRLDANRPTPQTVAITRNCYFGEADTLFKLERWEEAVKAYKDTTARFLNQPESLEALLQTAQCQRKMGLSAEAQKTLNQAKQALARIPPESDPHFVSVTRGTREDWQKQLNAMEQWD